MLSIAVNVLVIKSERRHQVHEIKLRQYTITISQSSEATRLWYIEYASLPQSRSCERDNDAASTQSVQSRLGSICCGSWESSRLFRRSISTHQLSTQPEDYVHSVYTSTNNDRPSTCIMTPYRRGNHSKNDIKHEPHLH